MIILFWLLNLCDYYNIIRLHNLKFNTLISPLGTYDIFYIGGYQGENNLVHYIKFIITWNTVYLIGFIKHYIYYIIKKYVQFIHIKGSLSCIR